MIYKRTILKNKGTDFISLEDDIAIEEPLEIIVNYGMYSSRKTKNIAVVMRTPGNDEELALGFLYTEGMITGRADLESTPTRFINPNRIVINLSPKSKFDEDQLQRNFYMTSGCGVCGKSSIDAIHQVCPFGESAFKQKVSYSILQKLPRMLFGIQRAFQSTGGIHASALFDPNGNLISFKEDVGRHNALDKLIGEQLLKHGNFPFNMEKYIVLLSGRASFELIQKAAMANVGIVCAIGAPSSLAIETAESFGLSLVGFLKDDSFNIYCGSKRIIKKYENQNS